MHNQSVIKYLIITIVISMITGCAGSNALKISPSKSFSFSDDFDEEDDKPKSDVFLDENGLPSHADLMKPGPLGEKWLGNEKAPVTIIKYASLTCPYCRAFELKTFKFLKKRYIDTGKVRYILREFPIGHQSGHATVIMRCIGQNDTKKFFSLYNKFITQQRRWVSQEVRFDPIFKVASQVGITRKKFDSCLKNQKIMDGLTWVKQRGRNLGVSGTPTFFINGKKHRSVLTIQEIQQLIDPHLS